MMHASNFYQFSDIDASQGSAATYLRRGGIINERFCCVFTIESVSEQILKIGQRLAVIDNIIVDCFFTHIVEGSLYL